MTIRTMMGDQPDEVDEDQAGQSMAFIKVKMLEAAKLVWACQAHFGISEKDSQHALGTIEDALGEMLGDEWAEAYRIYPCMLYSEKFPSNLEASGV